MEAVPGVVVLMHLKIVVEGLVYGFDALLYRMADDVRYALGPDRTEKKKSDINTSPALISHFDRTLLI